MIQSWTTHPHWGMRITPIIGNRTYIWLYNSDLHTHYIAGFPLWYRWPSTYTTLWLVLTMDHGTCTNHVEWIAVLLPKLRCRRLGASRFGMDWGHGVSQWIHELTSLEFTGHDSVYASYTCLLHPLTSFGNIIFTLYYIFIYVHLASWQMQPPLPPAEVGFHRVCMDVFTLLHGSLRRKFWHVPG